MEMMEATTRIELVYTVLQSAKLVWANLLMLTTNLQNR
jgi:hypothetical protein